MVALLRFDAANSDLKPYPVEHYKPSANTDGLCSYTSNLFKVVLSENRDKQISNNNNKKKSWREAIPVNKGTPPIDEVIFYTPI